MEQMEEQLCQTLITIAGSMAESDANQREQQFPGARWTSRNVVDRAKARSNSSSSPIGKYMIIHSFIHCHSATWAFLRLGVESPMQVETEGL
jgi:hypothetical protein